MEGGMIGAIAAAAGVGLILGVAGGIEWRGRRADKDTAALQSDLDASQDALATCEAKTVQESIAATGDVIAASQADDLAEAAHATRVAELTGADLYVPAVIDIGSDCATVTSAALAQCHASNTAGDSARSGCGPSGAVVTAWKACVDKLPACSVPGAPEDEGAP